MNEAKVRQIAIFRELREVLEREIKRIDRILQDLEWGTVETEEGEIIPLADWMESQHNHHL